MKANLREGTEEPARETPGPSWSLYRQKYYQKLEGSDLNWDRCSRVRAERQGGPGRS